MARRVAVTGLGVATALGADVDVFWRACLAGETRVEPIPERWRRHAEARAALWAPLPPLDELIGPLGRLDRLQHDGTALLALHSAARALEQAGIEVVAAGRRGGGHLAGIEPGRAAVALGTGVGGIGSLLKAYRHHLAQRPAAAIAEVRGRLEETPDTRPLGARLAEAEELLGAPPRLNPLSVALAMPNSAAGALGIRYGVTGPATTYCSACAAGTVALGHAFRLIRAGGADLVLAGGTEYLDDPAGAVFRGFDVAGALATGSEPATVNRPFDQDRTGFLFAEGGAAVLVLEELGRARDRGAAVLAEVVGYAETSDAYNPMVMAPDGAAIEAAVTEALADAGAAPDEVDYLNAHGTGTPVNDAVEAAVVERLFGRRPLVNSTKSLLGHTLGAAGAIEAVVAVATLDRQVTHGNRNLARPIADLRFAEGGASGPADDRPFQLAVTESFAFGGHNAVLVFRRALA